MKISRFISKIFKRDATPVVTQWGWDSSGDPIVTTPELGMKIAAVYRCVDILSKSIAELPLQIYSVVNGYRYLEDNNPINYLLQIKPNDRLNAFDFKRNAVIQMLMRGNAYIYPHFINGDLKELILISPGTCMYNVYADNYTVADTVNNLYGVFDSDEIIHLKNTSLDGGYNGESTIHYAARVLGISAATDNEAADIFKPGSTLRGFITGDETVTKGVGHAQAQLDTVRDRLQKQIDAYQKIFEIPGTMKFVPLSLSPADLQLLDNKKFNVLEICRFFGVHPDKVFSGQSQNYKASAQAQTSFMSDTLQPLLAQFENEFHAKLIPQSYSFKYLIKFDTVSYYETDYATKGDFMTASIAAGVMTTNEWRKREGLPPVKGGDQAFISVQVTPINAPNAQKAPPSEN